MKPAVSPRSGSGFERTRSTRPCSPYRMTGSVLLARCRMLPGRQTRTLQKVSAISCCSFEGELGVVGLEPDVLGAVDLADADQVEVLRVHDGSAPGFLL